MGFGMWLGIMAGAGINMDIVYLLTPFLAWLVTGLLKFTINSLKAKKLAFSLIGYGGFPSNHSAIVSSMAALIAFKEGMGHPAFGVAVTLAFIVILDAHSLRRQIGKHAVAINRMTMQSSDCTPLRERMGHTAIEIAAGVLVGVGIGGCLAF
ncbi:divergent PAP2 family protein [Methylobacter tundripaludum]